MSNEPLNKFQSAVNRATAAIGVKTSVFVESAKLKTQITTLKKEIDFLKEDLGIRIFELWEQDQATADLIEEQCHKINEGYKKIDQWNLQIEQLEREEANVMGAKIQQKNAHAQKVLGSVCPSCHEKYDEQLNFCRKCGTKM